MERSTMQFYTRWIMGFAGLSAASKMLAGVVLILKIKSMKHVTTPSGMHEYIPIINGMISLFVENLLFVAVVSWIVSEMAWAFGGQKDLSQATRTMAYALTPLWLSNLAAIPTMMAVAHNGTHWHTDAGIAGLWLVASTAGSGYFVYMVMHALPKTMHCDEQKKIPYALAVIFSSLVVWALIWLAGNKVL